MPSYSAQVGTHFSILNSIGLSNATVCHTLSRKTAADPDVCMMNNGSFPPDNTASYNLAEIWPFQITGVDNGGLELRSPNLVHSLGRFGDRSVLVQGEMITEHRASYRARKRRDDTQEKDSPKVTSVSGCADFRNDGGCKRVKTAGYREDNTSSRVDAMEQKQPPMDAPKPDYIHVRARRGQATDSHSLAERARREKISERMKILQDLVPGCNKVIGKALVLDEIINYIQSLQRQVELLSMKLEAVSSRLNHGIVGFPSKDFRQQVFDDTDVPFVSQTSTDYGRGSSPEWLHMQIGSNFERTR